VNIDFSGGAVGGTAGVELQVSYLLVGLDEDLRRTISEAYGIELLDGMRSIERNGVSVAGIAVGQWFVAARHPATKDFLSSLRRRCDVFRAATPPVFDSALMPKAKSGHRTDRTGVAIAVPLRDQQLRLCNCIR
jgi:hypothetical protein